MKNNFSINKFLSRLIFVICLIIILGTFFALVKKLFSSEKSSTEQNPPLSIELDSFEIYKKLGKIRIFLQERRFFKLLLLYLF